MQAVTRVGPNGRGGTGASFIVGSVVHQVSRSRYGKRAVQNMTRDVKPARNLVNASGTYYLKCCVVPQIFTCLLTVDQEAKSRIESEMREYQAELDMALARQKELDDEKLAMDAEDEGFKKRMVSSNLSRRTRNSSRIARGPSPSQGHSRRTSSRWSSEVEAW